MPSGVRSALSVLNTLPTYLHDFDASGPGVEPFGSVESIVYVLAVVTTPAASAELFDASSDPHKVNRTAWWVLESPVTLGGVDIVFADQTIYWIDFEAQSFPINALSCDRIRYRVNAPGVVHFWIFKA